MTGLLQTACFSELYKRHSQQPADDFHFCFNKAMEAIVAMPQMAMTPTATGQVGCLSKTNTDKAAVRQTTGKIRDVRFVRSFSASPFGAMF